MDGLIGQKNPQWLCQIMRLDDAHGSSGIEIGRVVDVVHEIVARFVVVPKVFCEGPDAVVAADIALPTP